MGIMNLIRRFKKQHPDLDEIVTEMSKQYGVSKSDIIAAAVTAYANATGDDETRQRLANIVASKSSRGVGSMNELRAAMDMFKEIFESVADVMAKSQEVALKVAKNSIINEMKTNVETIEAIKKMGSTAGSGSTTDLIAQAFLNNILSGLGVQAKPPASSKKKNYNVEEISD